MRDSDVRAAVRRMLAEHYAGDDQTRIVEEMGIWSGSVRIDLAVINGELHGYELKSERDTLERLVGQADLYSRVFDRVTLVAAHRHIDKLGTKIPSWWGITVATSAIDGSTVLKVLKPAEVNPRIDALQVARLLWRAEALNLLERHRIDRGVRSATIEKMYARLAEGLSLDELRSEVRGLLKVRPGWLGQPVGNQ
jgi:hypothetical protein